MSRVEAAAADRLPWLPDEPQSRPATRRANSLLMWGAGVLTLVAGAGFWLGTRNVDQPRQAARQAAPSTTVRLPEPVMTQPAVRIVAQPEVNPGPAPEIRPSPQREVRIAVPRPVRAAPQQQSAAPEKKAEAPADVPVVAAAPAPAFVMPKPWNPRIYSGAAGRVVQIGAFGSVRQAKRGWWYMVRAYPAVAHLPAVVRPTRNSKGRIFYRFQVGTTSQAHSEVLCQRMQPIRFSCAVVGLPWKARVER